MANFGRKVGLIGGAGHVGLPLGLLFADLGIRTVIYDINKTTTDLIRQGVMPFHEEGADEMLLRVLDRGTLEIVNEPSLLSDCEFVVVIIGTPIDEHLNPCFTGIHSAIDDCAEFFRDGQVLILRSTVYPGLSRHIQRYLSNKGLKTSVAFCPERIAQGHSLRESRELPQLISAFDEATLGRVKSLFDHLGVEMIEMPPIEAELAKLMTNAWRYIQFATVNQFYQIATEHGLDFNRILHGCRHNYPRMAGVPGPGFAAGPCLVKDTMQLAAFSQNTFVLGHAAMLINEGLPNHLIQLAKQQRDLSQATVGILGMAFKAECDDPRDSLSYKMRKLLLLEAGRVLCTDPYVNNPEFVPLEQVLEQADVLFVATPHSAYRDLPITEDKLVIDVWDHATAASGHRPKIPLRQPCQEPFRRAA